MGLSGVPRDYNYDAMHEEIDGQLLEEIFYGANSRDKSTHEIAKHYIGQLLPDQKKAFKVIANSILGKSNRKLFFVKGSGGTGVVISFILIFKENRIYTTR